MNTEFCNATSESLDAIISTSERDLRSRLPPQFCIVSQEKIVYTNDEIKQLLGIKDERLRKFRDEGYLGYVKYPNSDKFWYTKQNLIDFLNNPIAVHAAWK